MHNPIDNGKFGRIKLNCKRYSFKKCSIKILIEVIVMKKVFLVLVLIGLVFTGFSKNIVEVAVSAGNSLHS